MTSGSRVDAAPRLVLDTSAYSHFRTGDTRVHDFIASAEVVLIPAVAIGELYGAFELGNRARENRAMLAELLAEPFVTVIAVSAAVARQYGRVYAALRLAGTPIPANDMWIAASAIDQGGCLLTFDHDFEHVAGLDRIVLEAVEPSADRDR